MKKTFLSIFTLLFSMAAGAQDMVLASFHEKVSSTQFTMNSTEEDVANYIIKITKGNCMIIPGTSLVATDMRTDAYGNMHVQFNLLHEGQLTPYQTLLHFRPDGTSYYINGGIPILDLDAPAPPVQGARPGSKISTEQASVIATGNTRSKVVETIVTYKNKPRVAYKVNAPGSLEDVYVDMYSGEVLYTNSHILSFAPWNELQGTKVNVLANTMYNGLQHIDAMKVADGYVLRDPVRNIITVNATDKYRTLPKQDFPDDIGQIMMLSDASEDFVFDEQQLQNAEYSAAVRSLFLRFTPKEGEEAISPSTTIRAYYVDKDNNPLGEILNIDNVTWTKTETGAYECEVTFPTPASVNLLRDNHIVEFTVNGEVYTRENVLTVSECTLRNVMTADGTSIGMQFNFDVVANPMQPALDAHWNIQKIYDMYDTYFGIKGSDGEGCQLVNIINPSNNFPALPTFPENATAVSVPLEDAYHNKTFYMLYGMGSVERNMKPVVDLSVIAHEYTHTVTAGCGNNLLPQLEPGALGEATADCMAMVAEDYAYGKPSWMIGSQIPLFNDNLRSFQDPWYSHSINGEINVKKAQPKFYGGRFWHDYTSDPKTDNGGVHINNGVFNYLFYLLCEGAQNITNEMGQTHTIEPVGMDKMKDILFHSMLYYNCSMCDYAEIADNLMITVEDMMQQNANGKEKLQEQLSIAYQHVGMTTTFQPVGITTVTTDAKSPYSGTYNLYGMPVDDSYKGVVIRNGKKIASLP